jgi:hypothetical protein
MLSSNRILHASVKRGENFDPRRQFPAIHAYVRAVTEAEVAPNLFAWDTAGLL